MVALVLADALLEKFGGDSVPETARNVRAYLDAIPELLRTRTTGAEGADGAPDA
jgi:chorismate synthase